MSDAADPEETPPGPTADALDPDAIDRLRRLGGDELVRRMGDLFLELGRERMAAARAGVTYGDFDTIERAAHSLKSSAGNMGAVELQRRAEIVERAAAERRLDDAGEGVTAMEAAYAAARRRIEDLTKGIAT